LQKKRELFLQTGKNPSFIKIMQIKQSNKRSITSEKILKTFFNIFIRRHAKETTNHAWQEQNSSTCHAWFF